MAFKKDSKIKSNFTKITISLASPEESALRRLRKSSKILMAR